VDNNDANFYISGPDTGAIWDRTAA
jgi:hypothetical protein